MALNIINIVQARMSSARFPGKMIAELNGEPIIDWVLKRCLKSKTVHKTILATSDLPGDNVLADRANMLGMDVFRGSETDVLSRYASITKDENADVVVRVCGDRPLVDPGLIDMAVNFFLQNADVDLAYNHISGEGQNWPRGFGAEVLSAESIIDMDANLIENHYREHVTPYIWQNPQKFLVKPVPCLEGMDCGIPDVKCDLDTPADFKNLEAITDNLGMYESCETYFSVWKNKSNMK